MISRRNIINLRKRRIILVDHNEATPVSYTHLMNLSAGADKTNYPTLYLLALCQIAVYFVVFTLLILSLIHICL